MAKKSVDSGHPFAKLKELKDKVAAAPASPNASKANPSPKKNVPVAAPRTPTEAESEDAVSFERLFQGVTPLAGRAPAAQAYQAAAEVENVAAKGRLARLVSDGAPFEVSDDGERVEGRRADIPIPELRRLRRGQKPIDARLDLHGLSLREAGESLIAFIAKNRARRERCLLIIFGKGNHSPGGQGILRGEIAAWLSQGAASVNVAAFVTATEEDGGTGAVYVLLRH